MYYVGSPRGSKADVYLSIEQTELKLEMVSKLGWIYKVTNIVRLSQMNAYDNLRPHFIEKAIST